MGQAQSAGPQAGARKPLERSATEDSGSLIAAAAVGGKGRTPLVVFGDAKKAEVKLLMKRIPGSFDVLAIGTCVADLAKSAAQGEPSASEDSLNAALPRAEAVVVCAGTDLNDLNTCLAMMTRLRWIHSCSAGVEHLVKLPNLARTNDSHLQPLLTNARGVYRFSLAEFVLYSCKYFAIDQRRLDKQKSEAVWSSYPTCELRGRTIGIVGYGDIGRATACLARAYGMTVLAHRRDTGEGESGNVKGVPDVHGMASRVYGGKEGLLRMLRQCEFVCLVTPLTDETRCMFSTQEFVALDRRNTNSKGQKAFIPGSAAGDAAPEPPSFAKQQQSPCVPATPPPPPDEDILEDSERLAPVFINIGRGACCDTEALVEALRAGILRGAALDVTDPEPLPPSHPLWKLENVLISPHNADRTTYFQSESMLKFLELARQYTKAMRGGGSNAEDRLRNFAEAAGGNVVDKRSGY